MTRLLLVALAVTTEMMFVIQPAFSQDAANVAFEGHVFDTKTLRPLDNVYASFFASNNDGSGGGSSELTDSNGFYQLEVIPTLQAADSKTLSVICRTRRGDVQVAARIYGVLRTEVYRRDFYLTLPRGISHCAP
jgi:hypothetical protein